MSVDAVKAGLVSQLLEAKKASKKTFSTIAEEVGYTNLYVAQLFHRQTQLRPSGVEPLKAAVPQLTPELIEKMQEVPIRSFSPLVPQDPTIYRFYEGVMHLGDSLKAIISEEFGDGIMSSVGFFGQVEKIVGKHGEPRVLVTFNGKFLEHTEQKLSEMGPPSDNHHT